MGHQSPNPLLNRPTNPNLDIVRPSHTPIADFWENMVIWIATFYNHIHQGALFLARGMGFHIPPDEPDFDAIPWRPLGESISYTGKQNIGNRDTPYYYPPQGGSVIAPVYRPPIEPSPPMDYYPTMPDEDEWIAEEQQEAFELIPLNRDLLIKEE